MLNTRSVSFSDTLWTALLNFISSVFKPGPTIKPHPSTDLVVLDRPVYAQTALVDIGRRFPVDPRRAGQFYRAADEFIV